MRVELSLAWVGVRHRPASWLLLVLGVALSTALPVFAAGLRTEAASAAVASAVAELPAASRTVLAVTSRDLRGQEASALDADVRAGLGDARVTDVQHALFYRPLSVGGQDASLGALDRLEAATQLTSGRWPTQCTPQACEVVAVAAAGGGAAPSGPAAEVALRQLGLTITGTANLTDPRVVGVRLVPSGLPLLLGTQPDRLAGLAALELFGRNSAWFGSVDGAAVAALGVPQFRRSLTDLSERANATAGPVSLDWPDGPITAAAQRAAASADRFAVLGAGTAVLQLGFCLVVAAGLRRRSQLVGRLLRRRGGGRAQVTAVAILQPLLAVSVGLFLGAAGGVGVVAFRGRGVQPAPGRSALQALVSVAPTLLVLAVAAVALVAVVARWPAAGVRAASWTLNGAAVVAVGVSALLLSGLVGTGEQLAATAIVTVLLGAGLVVARLWTPFLALLTRGPGRPMNPGTVARLVARRRPLMRMATAGFVAAACALLVLAGGYRSSLARSAEDQSAAHVPLDVAVQASSQVATPLDVLDTARLRAVSPLVTVRPVVSSAVSVFAGTPQAKGLPLTGVDPAALTEMHAFSAVTGASTSAAELARGLTVPAGPAGTAPTLPAGLRELSARVAGADPDLRIGLWVATPDGRERRLDLTARGNAQVASLTGGGSTAPGPMTVRAVELSESADYATRHQHGVGEGTTDRQRLSGTLRFTEVRGNGAVLPWSWADWGSHQATVSGAQPDRLQLRYQIGDARVLLGPGFGAAAGPSLPVAVDPDTAARAAGRTSFSLNVNNIAVPVVLVAVLPRMPTLPASFVVADRAAVTALLDRTGPGTAVVTQIWIGAPGASLAGVRDVISSSPASTAAVSYRTDLAASLRRDPVSTRSVGLLAAAGLVALLLAWVAVAALVRADAAETAADAYALELDGTAPAALRGILFRRAALVAALGVPLGAVAGLLLAVVAVHLLITGPNGAAVVPPLRFALPVLEWLAVVGAVLLGALLVATATTASTFREHAAQPAEVDLR